MNLRYLAGRLATDARTWLYSRRWFPLLATHARGTDWLYDLCRLRGSREARVLFDVGANVGQTSRHLLRYFPGAEIHAFELAGATAAELARNLAAYPSVHVHHLALSAQPGRARCRLHSCSEVNSLVFTTSEAGPGTEEVEISTVDVFCAAQGISRIDALKIDAQGSDLDVLRGAEAMLADGRIGSVYVEAGFSSHKADLQPFAPLDAHLTARGFTLAGLYEQFWLGPALSSFNALYVHPSVFLQ